MTRTLRTVAAIILAGLFPLPASAQRTDHAPFVADRPAAATRIVKRFGFDDRPDNPIGLPPNWIRAQHDPGVPRDRPGFPIWNEARVDLDRPAFAGDGSVVLPTRGGSTSLLLDPGVIAVLPTASYLVAAQVNGSGLEHARARVVVRVLDQRGDPIPGATAQSAAVAPGAGWTPIAVAIAADDPASAFLEIELLLLQPREFQRMPLLPEDLHVWPADYSGSIHFDEVTVLQMPSVHLTSPEPSNIIASDTPPELDVRLRDLAGEPLTADITVQDADGRRVAGVSLPAGLGHLVDTWRPALPAYGWYRAVCRVKNAGGLVGADVLDFAWMPPRPARLGNVPLGIDQRREVGIALAAASDAALPRIVDAVDAVGVGYASLPLLGPGADIAGLPERVMIVRQVADAIAARAVDAAINIGVVPPDLARLAQIESGDVIGLLAGGEESLGAEMLDAFGQLGQIVRRWQLGVEPVSRRPDLAADLRAAEASMSRLVPAPILGLAWPRAEAFSPAITAPQRVTVVAIEPGMGPEAIAERVTAWAEESSQVRDALTPADDTPELHLEFMASDPTRGQVLPRDRASIAFRDAIDAWELARRAAGVLSSTGSVEDVPIRVVLREPWTEEPASLGGEARGTLRPSAELAAWRTLADTLVDRRMSTLPLEIAPGVRSVLLEPLNDDGTTTSRLVLWQDEPAEHGIVLDMLLSRDAVRRIDIFGNARLVEPTDLNDRGVRAHLIPLSDEPVIIDGVDAALVRFQSSVQLDPSMLVSRHEEHRHELIMSNPWPMTLRGHFYIVEPGGGSDGRRVADRRWRITPRHAPFSSLRGETTRAPVDILFSAAEEAGLKQFVVDIDVTATQEYGRVRITREIELGLPGVEFDLSYRRGPEPGGNDIFVEARVLNTGDGFITASLRAQARGYPRDESTIADLGPEEAAVRIFPFKDGASELGGERISVALVLTGGGGRLTRSIEIPLP